MRLGAAGVLDRFPNLLFRVLGASGNHDWGQNLVLIRFFLLSAGEISILKMIQNIVSRSKFVIDIRTGVFLSERCWASRRKMQPVGRIAFQKL